MKKKCKKLAEPTEHAARAVKPKKKKKRAAPVDEAATQATIKKDRKRATPDDGGAEGPTAAEAEPIAKPKAKKKNNKHLEEPTAAEAEPVVTPKAKKRKHLGNDDAEEPAVAEGKAEPIAKSKAKKRKHMDNDGAEEPPVAEGEPVVKSKAKKEKHMEAEAPAGGANGTNSDEAYIAPGHAKYSCFVGGVPFSCEEEEVRRDFSECGEVVGFRFPRDSQGYPKGFCFIDFATREGLDAALAYDGDDYGGRSLQVKETALRKPSSKGAGKGGPINPGAKPDGCKSVILKNLAYGVTDFDIRRHFQPAGNIVNVTLLKDRKTQEPNGIAFVDFGSTEQVDAAIKMNDTALKGRKMHVSYSTTKRK